MPSDTHSRSQNWLCLYAAFTAVATLGLIGLGGLVTSHGVGMAVPDWPTTYGYNMFLFPISLWKGGVFYEHTHRLYASAVGLLTVILALWLHWKAPRRRLAKWGWIALALVIFQGVLGGLRVNLMKDQIGIFHAALAQAFLVLIALIAVGCSRRFQQWREAGPRIEARHGRWVFAATILIFVQLILGASMRHQHAGLAVPDFPTAYGQLWPATDEAFLQKINAQRIDTRDFHPITAAHVHLHMVHRCFGMALGVLVLAMGWRLRRIGGRGSGLARLGTMWMVLIVAQVFLGAVTVWSNKAADMATLHVVVGACCLVIGAWSTALCRAAALPVGIRSGSSKRIEVLGSMERAGEAARA